MSTLEWMLYSEVLIACHTPHGTKIAGGEEHCSVLQPWGHEVAAGVAWRFQGVGFAAKDREASRLM